MIHMGSAIEMMRLYGNLEVALWDAGRQVGIYGGILNAGDAGEKEDNDDRLGTVAVSYTYVKNHSLCCSPEIAGCLPPVLMGTAPDILLPADCRSDF